MPTQELPFHSPQDFTAQVAPEPAHAERPGYWFIFRGDQILVEEGPADPAPTDDLRVPRRPVWARLPLQKNNNILCSGKLRTLYLGSMSGTPCWAAELPAETPAPAGYAWHGLRTLFSVLDDRLFSLAGRALQLIDWDRSHQYCGRCGSATRANDGERVRTCPACSLAVYPRIAPAVMAIVRRGREVLLARSPRFPAGMYSALAGFVEPGETIEQCVAREVAEEVGIQVGALRYFASQPWPFPHSLMIAFVCDWTAGEIQPREEEIEAADWFDVFHLPKLPSRISIARRLIDVTVEEMRGRFDKPGVLP